MKNIFFWIFSVLTVLVCCKPNTRNVSPHDYAIFLRNSFNADSTYVEKHDSVFYIAVGIQDTFWYAIDKNDSVYLWAIQKGEGIHMIRDIN